MKKIVFYFIFIFLLLGCSVESTTMSAPVILGARDWTLEINEEKPDFLEDVFARVDDIEVDVFIISENVDMDRVGTYFVTYRAVNSKGEQSIKTITVQVTNNYQSYKQ